MTTLKKSPSSARSADPEDAASAIPDLETRIRQRAFEIYEASGREEGHDLDHWLQAEVEIRGRRAESAAA
jgi:hypothetical protein